MKIECSNCGSGKQLYYFSKGTVLDAIEKKDFVINPYDRSKMETTSDKKQCPSCGSEDVVLSPKYK